MAGKKEYFELSLDALRAIGRWVGESAERALPIYERTYPDDPRPRDALDGIRAFAGGGKRAASLRVLALDAFRASHETRDRAAAAAARAASLAASSAYTHPFSDVKQAQHILGPAAYAALAIETDQGGDAAMGDSEVRRAVLAAPREVREVLAKMPDQPEGKTRLEVLMRMLDVGVRETRVQSR